LIHDAILLAQAGHYWTEQYGTRSILMSGSVIGGAEDLGTVYYNPGRLSLIENRAFLLNANLYQLSRLRFINALDEGKDLINKSFGGIPGLVAGTFQVGFLPNHYFAYAIMARQRIDYDFFTRAEKEGNLFEGLPGEELLTGKFTGSNGYKDEWMVLTWSYAMTGNLSIGISNIYSHVTSKKKLDLQLQLLYEEDSKIAQLLKNRQVNFNHDALLWKIGLAWKTRVANIGMTMTTPKIHIRGQGSFTYENFESGLPDSLDLNHFESSIQNNIDSRHHSPLSIGAGTTFNILGKHLVHISAEWFNRIRRYDIIEAEPFIGQSTGELHNFKMYDEANQVINYGAGIEIVLAESFSFYGSYSTDFSYVTDVLGRITDFEDGIANSTFRADIQHLGLGFVLKMQKADITLGTTYAWGKESFPRPIDFPDEGEEGIFNSTDVTNMTWSRWRFIFSFSIPFLKDIQDKL
jgi:hypothetical protein